ANAAAFYEEQVAQGQFLASYELGKRGALEPLGRAAHLVMDRTSPAHRGRQVWIIHEATKHTAAENRPPTDEEMRVAVVMIRALYSQIYGVAAAEAAATPRIQRSSRATPALGPAIPADGSTILYCWNGACN
ncbi:MAG TPA: hypothetical protein VND45_06980, partial [Thermoanaerobaculia bacterium]|nr:hypothetical protein [Thermoanaerobaculia bacterium]